MNITLEQARTLDAVARHGSFAKAAAALHKVHSAVVYSLKGLEDAVGVALFDRSGYRAALTPFGRRVLEHCQRLIATEAELEAMCRAARAGHEPDLRVVFDGLLPVEPLLRAVRRVNAASPPTRVSLTSEFLDAVEARAEEDGAELMVTVVPVARAIGPTWPLPPLVSWLVAHAEHPLAALKRPGAADLGKHPFLTVRASDQRLAMSTSTVDKASEFKLSDFPAKRSALLARMGYGWMPDHLVRADLARGRLVVLPFGPGRGRHEFRPVLHCRQAAAGGKAAEVFVAAMTAAAREPTV